MKTTRPTLLFGLLFLSLSACSSSTSRDPSTIDFTTATGVVTEEIAATLTNRALLVSTMPLSHPDEADITTQGEPCVTSLGTNKYRVDYACFADELECPETTGTSELTGDVALFEAGEATVELTYDNVSIPCDPNNLIDWNGDLSFFGKVICGTFSGEIEGKVTEMNDACINKEEALILVLDDDGNDVVMNSFLVNEDCSSSTVTWLDADGEHQFECATDVATDECFQDINSVISVADCSAL